MHQSKPSIFTKPTKCVVCYGSIWMKKRCAKCIGCSLKYHLNCEPGLPNPCRASLRPPTDGNSDTLSDPPSGISASSKSNTGSVYSAENGVAGLKIPHMVMRENSNSTLASKGSNPEDGTNGEFVVETARVDEHSSDEEHAKTINQYVVHEVLGRGAFGVVRRAESKTDHTFYAIKEMSKKALQRKRYGIGNNQMRNAMDDLRKEISILKKLRHPNIIRLFEVLDDPNQDRIYMVFEIADRVVMRLDSENPPEPFPEDKAWTYFRHLLAGVVYLHDQCIVHRDIKPDNLLLKDDVLKISDFGVSEDIGEPDKDQLSRSVGSVAFWAPEMCTAEATVYAGMPLDVWAMGVTLYAFIFAKVPFVAPSAIKLFDIIRQTEVEIPESTGPDLRDLLLKMLDKNPAARPTAKHLQNHPWVTKNGTAPMQYPVIVVESPPSVGRHHSDLPEEDLGSSLQKLDIL
eukprot:comp20946_c0_seq1/m.27999 comp20946_c0_seq1/g.27999  ORF comp20946_c0_seq1/g.27999 comp20946_c0_seq1/m.27999 type:complete len:458 (-) comp20946_c0_seq1:440-1813(-)